MLPERWQDIKGNIKDNFSVEDEGGEHLDEEGGIDIEYIVFKGPLGRMRLEFASKPVVIDKKTNYSKRIGSETKVDYIYSPEEKSHSMTAYKWNDLEDEWHEIDAGSFAS
jgi:hypothetical protein